MRLPTEVERDKRAASKEGSGRMSSLPSAHLLRQWQSMRHVCGTYAARMRYSDVKLAKRPPIKATQRLPYGSLTALLRLY